jgi:hypothetical protein
MNLKSYLGPIALTFFTFGVGFYLLLGPSPSDVQTASEGSDLDSDVMKYFSFVAEQQAKQGAQSIDSQPSKKAGQI